MKLLVTFILAVGTSVAGLSQQTIPDAPSATRSPQSFPTGTKPAPKTQPQRPDGETPPSSADPSQDPNTADPTPGDGSRADTTAPDSRVKEMPPSKPKDPAAEDTGREGFRIVTGVNFVTVPVTVKDKEGHLVDGLLRKDFVIYEDGVAQKLKFFTSDPFPLSAALIVDQGMSDTAMRKVNQTLPAITGAFSAYDEVALYTYGNTVKSVSDFRAANTDLTELLKKNKTTGRQGGVPVVSGPMARGPNVNGQPLDPGSPRVVTPERDSHVLNDAILRAALDLSKQEKGRRRVIFVISDGKEEGSSASYADVLKVLLSNEISVYAIGVDSAAIPIYDKLAKIKLPGFGTGNILPKYVSATGGDLFAEFSKDAIEQSYAHLTGQARNQYTLGYTTQATVSSAYRSIEVRVKQPSLRVYARDGYYPLPRPRAQ